MTTIHVCSSSSSANGYILESGGEILILELGCKFFDYNNVIKDKWNSVSGCVSSHWHTDHLKLSTARDLLRRGITIHLGKEVYDGVLDRCDLGGFSALLTHEKKKVGQFLIQPFKVPHNVPNYGFLIITPTKERIVFVTDATECNYKFKDIDCIMVECNHDDDTLIDNFVENDMGRSHPETHMGLEDCLEFCKANTSLSTKQIILIHMSHTNINEDLAIRTIQDEIKNVKVSVAHAGDIFTIENDEF